MKSIWNKSSFAKVGLACLLTLALGIGIAYALQTPLTVVTPLGPYLAGAPGANALNFAFAACDNSLGNSFPLTGREILLIENTDTMAAHTVTISSVADQYGRTQDVTAYSVPESDFAAFNFRGGVTGFRQTDGTVHLACSAATIYFAVLTTPN